MVDPKLADVPPLESLHEYGEALEWGKAVVADVQACDWIYALFAAIFSSEPDNGYGEIK